MCNFIFSFIKIFEKEEYRQDFLRGHLYMNRLKYFKKCEDNDVDNIEDKYEGISAWLQPDEIQVNIGGVEIPSSDILAPVVFSMNANEELNVFCMYALHSNDFTELSEHNIQLFRDCLKIEDKVSGLGDYCVVFHKPLELKKRIIEAIEKQGFSHAYGLVKYFDPEKLHGSFDGMEAVFHKRNLFQHQKEYRIAIDTRIAGDSAYTLDIGNIEDICICCDTGKLNEMLSFSLPSSNS